MIYGGLVFLIGGFCEMINTMMIREEVNGKLLRYRTIISLVTLHPFVIFIVLFILWLKK